MRKLSLQAMFLVPILVTILLGFTAFAVFTDRVERANRLADVEDRKSVV